VQTLKAHFKKHPDTFARFDSGRDSATPIRVPTEMAETFVQ